MPIPSGSNNWRLARGSSGHLLRHPVSGHLIKAFDGVGVAWKPVPWPTYELELSDYGVVNESYKNQLWPVKRVEGFGQDATYYRRWVIASGYLGGITVYFDDDVDFCWITIVSLYNFNTSDLIISEWLSDNLFGYYTFNKDYQGGTSADNMSNGWLRVMYFRTGWTPEEETS